MMLYLRSSLFRIYNFQGKESSFLSSMGISLALIYIYHIINICFGFEVLYLSINRLSWFNKEYMSAKVNEKQFEMPSYEQIAHQYHQYFQTLKKHQPGPSADYGSDEIYDSDQDSQVQEEEESSFQSQIGDQKDQEEIILVKVENKDQRGLTKYHRSYRKKGNKERKIRTTITRERLQKMNEAFQYYCQAKEKGNTPPHCLREIGLRLQLGYSTILHKFREYRLNRRVKQSVLLLSKQKKRKYRKSINIERDIEQALYERPFFTAIQLSKHLHKTRNLMLSRSIISRHLQEMGYSFNNMRNLTMQKNSPKYIAIRKDFATIIDQNVEISSPLIFIDQFAFCVNLFKKHFVGLGRPLVAKRNENSYNDYISLMIAADKDRIYYYEVKSGFFTKEQFKDLIRNLHIEFYDSSEEAAQTIDKPVILTDTNRIHYDSNEEEKQPDSIEKVIQECGFIRYFIPPGSPQLNPLLSMFMRLKENLGKQDRMNSSILGNLLNKQMQQMSKSSIEYYFKELPSWIQRARNEQEF